MIAHSIKWDQNWQSQIKAFARELDEIKNKQVGALLTEGDALQTEKVKLSREIRQLKDEQSSLSQVFLYHLRAKKELDRLNDVTNKGIHNPREKNFLGTGAGTKWNTTGWLKSAETHFTPASGSTGKLDNLYKLKISGTEYETTEEQVINLIARVVKALQKVDSADFEAKYNAKETDTAKQAQVKAYLKEIQDQAVEIVVGAKKDSEGNSKQPSYDFSHNFHKGKFNDNGVWQPEATDYSQSAFNYANFFKFLELVHGQPFLSDLDNDKQKDIDKNENWQIFLKGVKWEAEKLKDYGITIDSSKTDLYKTSETDKQTISTTGGISGWLDLAHSFTQNANNQTKLAAAFTNSPTQQLLTDLNGWNQGADGYLTDSTNWTLPESAEEMEVILAELESKKLSSASEQGLLAKQISQKNKELKQKTTDLKAKETELDTLIKEIITKQRAKLTTYKISDGFKDQYRRTETELFQIQQILENIRYLENDGDKASPSSESGENTAYDQIVDLRKKLGLGCYSGEFWLVQHFKDLAFKKTGEEAEQDISQAVNRIKEGKYTDAQNQEHQIYQGLSEFHAQFEAKAQLVKLSEWEQKAQAALKAAIEKKDPTEQLPDWQSKLKALDPLITETIFTKTKMEDFQKHTNFGNINTVEGLFKKVMEAGTTDNTKFKVKADFIAALKKADSEVDDLAKMITKFEAEKVIKLIHLYEYEKSAEDEQKKKRRAYSWDRDKKVSDKYVAENGDYILAETDKEDFQKFLYQLATGAKSLSSISRPTEKNEDNGNKPTPKTEEGKKWYEAYYYMAAWLPISLAVIGGLTYAFWDQIRGWFDPKEEGENESDDE